MDINQILINIAQCDEIVEINTTPARLFIFISHLQLALRVQGNNGESTKVVREMVSNLTKMLCHYVPEAKELIEMGWNPENDVTSSYFDLEFPLDLEPEEITDN